MSASLLFSAQFLTTATDLRQLPATGLVEVAFTGRSNAGKSTAINKLCNRNRLAFAGRTPGRTQALNYFSLSRSDGETLGYLVDTPGYGYAAAPGDVRQQWSALAGRYLAERAQLSGVVLMIDIRRLIGPRDVDLLRWLAPHTPVLILLTKADKLGRMHQRQALDKVRDQLAALGLSNPASLLLFSALRGIGIEAARACIDAWFPSRDADRIDAIGATTTDAPGTITRDQNP